MEYFELSQNIMESLEKVSKIFGEFQKKSGLRCPIDCGKCCFKPDVSCTPFELLPFALHLLETNRAEEFLEKAKLSCNERCLLLNITNEESGQGYCSEYQFRPFVCRAFGVSARHGKNEKIDFSICKVLKSDSTELKFNKEEIPFIEEWKKNLEAIDPHLSEREVPINQALIIILEKVLLWDIYRDKKY